MTTAKVRPIKKCEPHPTCKDGQHVYVVTAWQIGNGKEKAIAMRCRQCLMPLDLQEMESAEWAAKNVKS